MGEDWQSVAAAHSQKQYEAIPTEWKLEKGVLDEIRGEGSSDSGRLIKLQAVRRSGLLSERELHITEDYTATQLLDSISRRKFTSFEVTLAFSKRAALAQQLVRISRGTNYVPCVWADNGDTDILLDGDTI